RSCVRNTARVFALINPYLSRRPCGPRNVMKIALRSPRPGAARSNDRRDCPPAVPPDLEDPASGRPVQGTRPSPEPKVQATPDGQNDPRTPKLRLSGRTGQRPVDGCSRVATGIFDPESANSAPHVRSVSTSTTWCS